GWDSWSLFLGFGRSARGVRTAFGDGTFAASLCLWTQCLCNCVDTGRIPQRHQVRNPHDCSILSPETHIEEPHALYPPLLASVLSHVTQVPNPAVDHANTQK